MHARTNWKMKFLAGALSLGAFGGICCAGAGADSECRLDGPLRRCGMSGGRRLPGAGYVWVDGYWGVNRRPVCVGSGPMGSAAVCRAPIGAILTMTTTTMAGISMKATGIVRTTAITTTTIDDDHDRR